MAELSLLDLLAIYCHVDYLSDLSLTPQCKKIIGCIDRRHFTDIKEWNEVVHYLTKNKDIHFQDVESAKHYLLNFEIEGIDK